NEGRRAESRLDGILDRLHLGPIERGVLLLAIAPEIDLRYQRIYAYLHDDIAKKAPTVDLAATLLAANAEERLRCRRALAPEAPLRAFGLVEVHAPEADRHAPFSAHLIQLTERAVSVLLGDGARPTLPPFAEFLELSAPEPHWSALEADVCRAVG